MIRLDLLERPAGRRVLFGALYFAEGAPIGFVWWTLPVVLRRAGWTKAEIGALVGTLVLPWAFKFLWAPLVDALQGRRAGLRAWIVVSQLGMIATLLPLAGLDLARDGELVTTLLVAHALTAATQDVAIDALAVRSVAAAERGAIQGWMQVGMLTGRGVFGGLVLAWRDALGDVGLVLCLVAAIAMTLPLHACYRPPAAGPVDGPVDRGGRWRRVASTLRGALRRRSTWWVLAFAATAGVTLETVGVLAGPWLVDLGFGDDAIGWFLALPTVVGLAGGALLGGLLSDRYGRRPTLAVAMIAMAALAASLWALPPVAGWPPMALLGGVYLAGGVFTAASYGLFMDATDPRLGATQFSAYTGATNLCEAWSARLGGSVATAAGTGVAMLVAAGLGLACLVLLLPIGGRRPCAQPPLRP